MRQEDGPAKQPTQRSTEPANAYTRTYLDNFLRAPLRLYARAVLSYNRPYFMNRRVSVIRAQWVAYATNLAAFNVSKTPFGRLISGAALALHQAWRLQVSAFV